MTYRRFPCFPWLICFPSGAFRLQPAIRLLPILTLTAHARKGDRERCLAAGMDGYVSKPIDFDQLAQAIADVLGPDRL